jgi:hypothetical protein
MFIVSRIYDNVNYFVWDQILNTDEEVQVRLNVVVEISGKLYFRSSCCRVTVSKISLRPSPFTD